MVAAGVVLGLNLGLSVCYFLLVDCLLVVRCAAGLG